MLAVIVGLVIGIGSILLGATHEQQQALTLCGAMLVTGYAVFTQLAVTIKRCHDRGRSAWWCLLTLIPFIGLLWLILDLGMGRGKQSEDTSPAIAR